MATVVCHCADGSARPSTSTIAANADVLLAVAINPEMGVGAPWYTSGVHMWNGTAETLKKNPTSSSAVPPQKHHPGVG